MLAKVAPPSNDFHALVRYLVRGRTGTTPHPSRVAWIRTQNLPTDDPELAAKYMEATALLSPRTKKAAYHMMIAWHASERPSPDLMQAVATETLKRAGLDEHQALIMGHGDKPHPHLHILLNRVHPATGRAWKTTHDYARFDRIMRDLAEVYGCAYVPAHVFNTDLTADLPKQPNSAATYAAKRGAPTARPQWPRNEASALGKRLSEDLSSASTIDDLAALLDDNGLTLEPKGHGYVVGDHRGYAKLSSLGLTRSAYQLARVRVANIPALYRPILTVDEIDVARAFYTMGVLSRDALREAIDGATLERQQRMERRPASHNALCTTSMLTAPPNQPARQPRRPRAFSRGRVPRGR
jgi:hypothetical protein